MRVAVRAAAVTGALAAALSVLPTTAFAAGSPGAVTSVSAVPGAQSGEIKVSWRASGARTDKFRVETALTPFRLLERRTRRLHGHRQRVQALGDAQRRHGA